MPGPFALSIRQRVSLSIVGLLSISYAGLLFSTDFVIRRDRLQRHERLALAMAEVIQQTLDRPFVGSRAEKSAAGDSAIQNIVNQFSTPAFLVWLSRSGKPPLFPASVSGKDFSANQPLMKAASTNLAPTKDPVYLRLGNEAYVVSSLPIDGSLGAINFIEDVGIDPSRSRGNLMFLIGVWFALVFVSVLVLDLLLRLSLRPVGRLERALDRLSLNPSGSVEGQQVPLSEQPFELQGIAAAFNRLSERLQHAWARETLFIRALSHELLTPIALISGTAQRLLHHPGQFDASQLEGLHAIHAESSRADRLARDMLDLARGDSGSLALTSEPFDPLEVVQDVIRDIQVLPWGPRVVMKQVPDLHRYVDGDSDRFRQCLLNILENAVKYSPDGSPITIRMGENQTSVSLQVHDLGPGVPREERDKIFQPFYRSSALAPGTSGSGVGLAVVRLLMEQMNGSVHILDVPDSPGCVELLLPIAAVPGRAIAEPQS